MIKMDYNQPLPFVSDLKRGCCDSEIEDAITKLQIDPEKDEDIRLWFGLQNVIRNLSLECNLKTIPSMKEVPVGRIVEIGSSRRILKDYWVPRKDWDLVSLVGGYEKLNHTDGDVGLKLLAEHWEPKTDTAILRSCSGVKPYHSSAQYKFLMKKLQGYKYDLMAASYTPTPLEVDEQYPFAFYQGTMWPNPPEWQPYNVTEFFEIFNAFKNIIFYLRPESYGGKGGQVSRTYTKIDSGEIRLPKTANVVKYWESLEETSKGWRDGKQLLQAGVFSNRYYSMHTNKFIEEAVEPYCEKETITDDGNLF